MILSRENREAAIKNESHVETVQARTPKFLNQVNDTTYADKKEAVTEIHIQAASLQVLLDEMMDGLLSFVDQAGVPVEDVRYIDNMRAGRDAILDNGKGKKFALVSREYKEMLDGLIKDPVTSSQIEDHLEFTGNVWSFEYGLHEIKKNPLMKNYYKLTDASKGIALSEYIAISTLLHHHE